MRRACWADGPHRSARRSYPKNLLGPSNRFQFTKTCFSKLRFAGSLEAIADGRTEKKGYPLQARHAPSP
jgi:hypothetical protein